MKKSKHFLFVLGGPLLALLTYLYVNDSTDSEPMAKMAGIAVWMAWWWITEAVSLYVTSLLPLLLFPLTGVLSMRETSPNYTNEIIFLFVGGFMLAIGIEKWGLHRRIALKILGITGRSPSRVILGFMLAAWFLSMWMSNTATTMMLLPAAIAVVNNIDAANGLAGIRWGKGILLGTAYGASIGGMATLVGTPPNMIFAGFYLENFPDGNLTFAKWIVFGLPFSFLFLMASWRVLRKLFISDGLLPASPGYAKNEYRKLGPVTKPEARILTVFSMVILLWLFRNDIDIGFLVVPGWSQFLSFPRFITDSTVAIAGALALFFVPSGRGGMLISWPDVKGIPLGVIFLFGGGFALAEGISASGLGDWFAAGLGGLNNLHPFILILVLCTCMTFFSELTSNTASTALVLPILLSISQQSELPAMLIMIPVVFAGSFGFMLPVATPPNTLAFGTEKLEIRDMVRAGFWLNIIGIVMISLAMYFFGGLNFY